MQVPHAPLLPQARANRYAQLLGRIEQLGPVLLREESRILHGHNACKDVLHRLLCLVGPHHPTVQRLYLELTKKASTSTEVVFHECYSSVTVNCPEAARIDGTYTLVANVRQGDRPVYRRVGKDSIMDLSYWPANRLSAKGHWRFNADYKVDKADVWSLSSALCPVQVGQGEWIQQIQPANPATCMRLRCTVAPPALEKPSTVQFAQPKGLSATNNTIHALFFEYDMAFTRDRTLSCRVDWTEKVRKIRVELWGAEAEANVNMTMVYMNVWHGTLGSIFAKIEAPKEDEEVAGRGRG